MVRIGNYPADQWPTYIYVLIIPRSYEFLELGWGKLKIEDSLKTSRLKKENLFFPIS